MGRLGYFIFYTLCGIAAALIQVAVAPRSEIPIIGASGAIAGVLGAYLLLYPTARVSTLVPVFYFIRIIWLPAILVLGLVPGATAERVGDAQCADDDRWCGLLGSHRRICGRHGIVADLPAS